MQTDIFDKNTSTSEAMSALRGVAVSDGLMRQNIVLMSGLLTAPVIGGAKTLESALIISFMFTLLSFLTVAVCRFIPRKIVYTLRIIIYVTVAAVLYIGLLPLTEAVFGRSPVDAVGVYLPILAANPLIISKTESRLYMRPIGMMFADTALFILGFDLVAILVGGMRDILVSNRLGYLQIPLPFTVPALETTFGGFMLVGVLAGLFHGIYNRRRKKELSKKDFTITLK